jgi:hypothetical protein
MTVAVKVMDIRANKHMRLVRHELDINMMLQHPNVVRCLDYHVSGQVGMGVLQQDVRQG